MDVNSKALLFSSILSLAVTGCGGGSGGSSSPSVAKSSDSSSASISGAVADGYLYGATVCLDMNDNKRCDQSEPTATSGTNGQYTLLNVTAEDAAKHAVVVEVSASTIDEDTGSAVGKSYVLTSPPGKYAFVSPLTTLVHTTMDMLKTTEGDAEQIVKQNMAFDRSNMSLFNDYIKGANEAPYQQLHKIAQIAAYILGQNHQTFNEAAQREGLSVDEQSVAIHNLLVQHVFSQLASIKVVATAKADDSAFTENELAALDVQLNTANIKSRLEKETEVKASTKNFDIKTVFEKDGGLSSIDKYDCDSGRCTYENDTIILSVNADLTYDWEHSQKAYQSGVWTPVSSPNFYWNHSDMLVDGKWVYHDAKKTGSTQTEVAPNQIALMPLEVVSFIQLDIAGKKIVPFLASNKNLNISEDIVNEVAGSNAAFSSGAKAYLSSVMASADIYRVSLDNDFNSCVGTTIPWIDETTNCNNVTSGDPRVELRSIEELFSGTNDKAIHTSNYTVTLNRENAGSLSGTVKINLNNSSSIINSIWEIRDASPGITVVAIQIPAKMKKLDEWYSDGPTEVFFTVIDGYLRAGEYTPAGAVTEWTGYEFNSVAMGNILDQFNP
ncbi:hypothetical protein [Alkalimarinus sediminis]|uniref:Lipoprotein n=1 Tax=Alkalimarinus sediminis TaxID=1632866 RepID=A0A9E8HJE3_9ALTE|nr:hypothetical protein [Alkalimarinus sediminis]UZW74442.1 hypothetical protein NNL22_15665 [Alkalimarinus sediminis]